MGCQLWRLGGDLGVSILVSLCLPKMEMSYSKMFKKGISETLFICLSPDKLLWLWNILGLCPTSGQVSSWNDGKSFGRTLILPLLGRVTVGGVALLCEPVSSLV